MREKAQSGQIILGSLAIWCAHDSMFWKLKGAGALKIYSQKSLKRTLVATLIIFTVNE